MPVTWPVVPPVRLMGDLGLRGVRRAKSPRTTRSAPKDQCPADLARRHFEAFALGGLWVADIPPLRGRYPSYVRAFSGWVYVAFVTYVYSRRIIGWQTTYRPVCTDLALDALEMAVWQRKRTGAGLTGLVHHLRPWGVSTGLFATGLPWPSARRSPRWGQGRLLSALPWPRRSSSLYKAELIRNQGPWADMTPPVLATAEWVHWAGTTRPYSAIGMRAPAEHEAAWAPDRHRHEQSQPATTATR